jgi:transcriptional regulator GlxA family with amidase domain
LRVNAARHLLEDDLKTVRQVSRAVGYEDLGFFRRLFKRHTGQAPQKYRERFGKNLPESLAVEDRTPQV